MTRDSPIHLTFDPIHVEPILAGTKTATLRYDFERDVATGDELLFVNAESEATFARAFVSIFGIVTVRWFVEGPHWEGHRSYQSTEELLEELAEYYPDADLGPRTELTLIRWTDFEAIGDHPGRVNFSDSDGYREASLPGERLFPAGPSGGGRA